MGPPWSCSAPGLGRGKETKQARVGSAMEADASLKGIRGSKESGQEGRRGASRPRVRGAFGEHRRQEDQEDQEVQEGRARCQIEQGAKGEGRGRPVPASRREGAKMPSKIATASKIAKRWARVCAAPEPR